MSKDEEERGKKRFFESLYDLDQEEETDAKDDGRLESIAFLKRTKSASKRPRTAPELPRTTSELGRTRTRPQLDATTEKSGLRRTVSAPTQKAKHSVMDVDTSERKAEPSKPTTKLPGSARQTSNSTKSKRKRTEDVKLAPAARRIFTGLTIFFFPNNDSNGPRRERIKKAIEYGAAWSREWGEAVSHIIVDKSFNYAQLLDFFKLQSLPRDIVVVNETYPADCLAYRCLLDPKQKSYRVPGHAEASEQPGEVAIPSTYDAQQSSAETPSTQSLELKPPTKAVLAREPFTPSQVGEESSAYDKAVREAAVTGISAVQPEEAVYDDALNETMIKAKAMQHVPLDIDEDGDDLAASASQDDSDAEDSDKSQQPTKAPTKSKPEFRCMQKHDGTNIDNNPNARTIEVLQKMATYYEGTKDEWRVRAYRNAITTLRKQPRWITSAAEARLLPQIGSRLAEKIEEIATTSELRRLKAVTSDPRDAVLQTFTRIYGVGIAQASKWVEQGFRSLGELRDGAKLTPNQEVGLAHYDDFLERIPREEVRMLGETVAAALRKIDPGFEVTVGGSYRRGSKDSGDVDLIITKPEAPASTLQTVVLGQLVPRLFDAGFLKCALASSSKEHGRKWHGACALPGESKPWRRIDLLLVPWEEMGAALIYFTGNDIFNRSIRLLASRKGMRLNQCGLYKDVMRGRGRERVTDGELLEGRDERRIFEILGVAWRPPEHRIC